MTQVQKHVLESRRGRNETHVVLTSSTRDHAAGTSLCGRMGSGGWGVQEAGFRWGMWAHGQMSTCPSAIEWHVPTRVASGE